VRRALEAGALAAAAIVATHVAGAQSAGATGVAPELRADVIVGNRPAVQAGAGVQIPVGYYVRVGLVAAAGVRTDDAARRPASTSALDGRVDLLVRFLLDPFRQTRYGFSIGGGLSARAEPGDQVRPVLLVAAELEGRRSAGGWVPAVQVGLGGGGRIGIVLRRGAAAAR
jgi:hypothetical protein